MDPALHFLSVYFKKVVNYAKTGFLGSLLRSVYKNFPFLFVNSEYILMILEVMLQLYYINVTEHFAVDFTHIRFSAPVRKRFL